MPINYCGFQLARSLGWVSPAYLKKEGTVSHPGACSIDYNMMGDLIGALACRLLHGIYIALVKREKFVKK